MQRSRPRSAADREPALNAKLRVDPIACDGHGLCAELFPEWIELDDWGYPIINAGAVPPGLEEHARRAIKECPKLALRLVSSGATRHGRSATAGKPPM